MPKKSNNYGLFYRGKDANFYYYIEERKIACYGRYSDGDEESMGTNMSIAEGKILTMDEFISIADSWDAE